ncbi:coagulation factor 5/8 type domain-containing protein, partial [Streptomyces sp. SAI-25]
MPVPPTAPRSGATPRRRRRSRALGFAALAVSLLMAVPTAQTAFGEEARDSREIQAVPGGGDLGPNVHVFDPSTPGIQGKVDEIFKKQESAQFGLDRHALLFKPGTYDDINAQIGFYTSIAGLGLHPNDTTFNGDVTVDAGWFDGNATQNFWRSAENLTLNPVNGTNRWAVSQAAPFRRMHVKGGLNL